MTPGGRLPENPRILHLSAAAADAGAGGAALATHEVLRRLGRNSKILFMTGDERPAEGVYVYANSPVRRLRRLAVTRLERAPLHLYPHREKRIFSPALVGLPLKRHPLVQEADVIHLNWVNHGFLDLSELGQLNKAIVWTLHDMWGFTGGCHYSFGCQRYQTRCGACPMLHSESETDLSTRVFRRKQRTLPRANIEWVAISSWMKEASQSSTLLANASVNMIHSGIDTRVFRHRERVHARSSLGLPLDRSIILLGAADLRTASKGLRYSLEALKAVDPSCLIVTFGNGNIDPTEVSQECKHLGFIGDAERMSMLYSSANVFLATSIAEAFGKTLAEAQCCGTPVVAFDLGGPRDIVEHLATGYLARPLDSADVAAGIRYCLDAGINKDAVVARARRRFDLVGCTEQYMALYDRVLARASEGRR